MFSRGAGLVAMLGSGIKRASAPLANDGARNVAARHMGHKIIYTKTDEAPMLATYALLPIINRFTKPAGIEVETSDISVAGRVISHFPEALAPGQRIPDNLSALGDLAKTPEANIIKLPNISASIPQLQACIKELQAKGFAIPDFPANPKTDAEKDAAARYAKVLGSAVNPVLREGNSDRRVAPPVKAYAQKNPHKMGAWSPDCRSRVAHMQDGDFFSSEQSKIMPAATSVKITLHGADGSSTVLKEETALLQGEVLDAAVMSVKSLRAYYEEEMTRARDEGIMLSLHLKATMMKVSDPILFGHAVTVFFKDAFDKYGADLAAVGANPNNGLGAVLDKVKELPAGKREEVEAAFTACYGSRPGLAMVNSAKGITNLHVPSDVIIDASMPVVVRDSGKMWNKDDKLEDTVCLIPDRCYATMYQAVLDFCRQHGQFDVATMGTVPNVGLMAQKAQEYGSHDKTFQIPKAGEVVVTTSSGEEVFRHKVAEGDIWRACQTKDEPIRDWVRLAVSRARATGDPAVFWLDSARAHDKNLIGLVSAYLEDHDTSGLDISVLKPVDAVNLSMERAKGGKNTISCTGNVLRDYLTDLFPILELGTSAKMLSIVPLLAGGGLFETGAGGSAPKHVQQFEEEGHLRWDSLGEYLAIAVSLEDLAAKTGNDKARQLADTLMAATGKVLDNRKSPSRKVNELDNRGTSFYLAMYWAEAMAAHDPSFAALAKDLAANEDKIIEDLLKCQGAPQDIGGYYHLDDAKAEKCMRPSATLNAIIDK